MWRNGIQFYRDRYQGRYDDGGSGIKGVGSGIRKVGSSIAAPRSEITSRVRDQQFCLKNQDLGCTIFAGLGTKIYRAS